MNHVREFVCDDCKANVFEMGELGTKTLCNGCNLIREMKSRLDGLTPQREAQLREILGCMIPTEEVEK